MKMSPDQERALTIAELALKIATGAALAIERGLTVGATYAVNVSTDQPPTIKELIFVGPGHFGQPVFEDPAGTTYFRVENRNVLSSWSEYLLDRRGSQ